MPALRTALALALLPGLAFAQTLPGDPPLDAAAFDALTRGRTFETHSPPVGLYGIETFLPGRRVYWRDARICAAGTWRQVGEQICFDYEHRDRPVCWTYHDRNGWIEGFFEGDRRSVPIMLHEGGEPVSCEGWTGV